MIQKIMAKLLKMLTGERITKVCVFHEYLKSGAESELKIAEGINFLLKNFARGKNGGIKIKDIQHSVTYGKGGFLLTVFIVYTCPNVRV